MTALESLIKEKVLLLDGAMGTQIFAHKPTLDDYGGAELEGCVEVFNERRPDWIKGIHAAYFEAGADAVETNTFGCNEVVLAEFGLAHRTEELNALAVRLAKEVARDFRGPRYVIGSVGPGPKLVTLGHVDPPTLYRSYLAQCRGLLKGGADAILIETCQDLGQIKGAVRAAKAAMAEMKLRVPLWVQVTVETTGTLLLGSDIGAQVAGGDGQADGARQRRVPGPHHGRQRVAHRAGPVVELHRAADVDAARVHLHRHAAQPALEQRTQPRLAARFLDGREEHLFLEACVVFANDGDLKFLARTEVGEDAGLAHHRDFGQRADGQTLQPHVRGQAECSLQDRGARLLALLQGLGQRPRRGSGLGDGFGGQTHKMQLNTNVRSILQTSVAVESILS